MGCSKSSPKREAYNNLILPQETRKITNKQPNRERTFRWGRSKTWRSPSSRQIHQKYIYMWNNSYRTPTERWQKTSDLPKGKKFPTSLGRAKEKRKNRGKRIGKGPAPRGGSFEEGSFLTIRNPFTGGDRVWQGRSIGATEESAAIGVQRAKWRDSHTEDRCQPALTSQRGLSAHPPGQVGAWS